LSQCVSKAGSNSSPEPEVGTGGDVAGEPATALSVVGSSGEGLDTGSGVSATRLRSAGEIGSAWITAPSRTPAAAMRRRAGSPAPRRYSIGRLTFANSPGCSVACKMTGE
jgi:hypothetical protein